MIDGVVPDGDTVPLLIDGAGLDGVPATVYRWLTDFVLLPHPDLLRSGAVCPFVEPAMRNRTLLIRRSTLDSSGLTGVLRDLRANVDRFRDLTWSGRNATLHALIVTFEGIDPERAGVLDDACRALKTEMVERGVMLGQFHAGCVEPAARNPRFMPFRSPVPMVAVRNMSFHDILFLHQEAAWFACYAARYGPRFRRPHGLDPLFVSLYRAAARQFGEP